MNKSQASLWQVLSASFLIAGTCIGGGMLALPVTSGQSGFLPSVLMMVVCWAYMCITGLLIAEASFWLKDKNAHMSSICSHFYGNTGKFLAWAIYLFIGYASLVAYIDGAGKILTNSLNQWMPILADTPFTGPILFSLFFGSLLLLGGKKVENINSILFIGLLISYGMILFTGFHEVELDYLAYSNFSQAHISFPILLTVFSYQAIVPSLPNLLNRNPQAVRKSIVIGTLLALVAYAVWQIIILGSIPYEGEHSLTTAFEQALPATEILSVSPKVHKYLAAFSSFFSFFAIVTSFLGIALGLYDFLGDGLKISKKGWGSFMLVLLVVIPSCIIALSFKRVFLLAMDWTGGFGDSILNGILPALIVWKACYFMKLKSGLQWLSSRLTLVLILAFSLMVIFIECNSIFNLL